MTNGNDLIEFEEKNRDELEQEFINQIQKCYDKFVFDKFEKR